MGVLADAELVAFLPTTDLDRTRVFFTEVVGLSVTESTSFACVFDSHGTAVRATLVEEIRPSSYTVLGWIVSDLPAAVRGLAARGVTFERFPAMDQDELDIWTTPGGDRVAWFKDPEGNVLSLTQVARVTT